MDERHFDRFTRAIGVGMSRRATLGALLGSAIASAVAQVAAKPHHWQRKRGRNGRAKRRPRAEGDSPVVAQAVDCLSLGQGSNVSGCNFAGENHSGEDLSSSTMVGTIFNNGTLIETNFSSSNLRNVRFNGANLCGADLRSSTLRNADFRNANLARADLSASGCAGIQFNAATTFCRTTMCDGTVRNDDCPDGPPPGFCCTDAQCPTGQACEGGVCCTTDPVAAIEAAADGAAVRVCAGTYRVVNLFIAKNLTIVGAGAEATIFDGQQESRVLLIGGTRTVVLRDLTITGGKIPGFNGGGILNLGNLTLIGVTVRDNETGLSGGGILHGSDGVLTLQAGSRVENNTAGNGGGIRSFGSATLDPDTVVINNTPDNCEPTIGTCS